MSEEIKEIFNQWKQFLSWCYENNDKTIEIHRDNLERVMAYTRQLENIIKEVREKLKELVEDDGTFIGEIDYLRKKELLEILNKGE